MADKVLNVTEARKSLPKLLQRISHGGSPVFFIGARGRPAAVLVAASSYDALRRRAAAAPAAQGGWAALRFEIATTPSDLDQGLAEIRAQASSALARRADQALAPPAPRKRRARRP